MNRAIFSACAISILIAAPVLAAHRFDVPLNLAQVGESQTAVANATSAETPAPGALMLARQYPNPDWEARHRQAELQRARDRERLNREMEQRQREEQRAREAQREARRRELERRREEVKRIPGRGPSGPLWPYP